MKLLVAIDKTQDQHRVIDDVVPWPHWSVLIELNNALFIVGSLNMNLKQKVRSFAMNSWINPKNIAKGREKFHKERVHAGLPHQVKYFHQVDDPYSYLAAQALAKLENTYYIELQTYVVSEPDDVDVPERALLSRYARSDCQNIAPHYGLSFSDKGEQPDAALVKVATFLLLSIENCKKFIDYSVPISRAIWENDGDELNAIAEELGVSIDLSEDVDVQEKLQKNHKLRSKLGHYLGATFFYGGLWFWGVDRMEHLQDYLKEQGLKKVGVDGPAITRPKFKHSKNTQENTITLEYFHSLRSPYTYISMARVFELADNMNINLVMRPVLPMMMRGVPATRAKGKYIFTDAKREAETVFNVPFENICDPFGFPVTRAYSLFLWAHEQGKSRDLFLNFYKAAFSKGVDLSQDAAMQAVVEDSGLDWGEAKKIIDNKDWEFLLEENRKLMYDDMGLWGVPSFRLSREDGEPLHSWGADRLWLLESEIEKQLIEA